MDSVFASQAVRLLAPALFTDDVCLISDLDMMPLSKSYFVDAIKDIDDDKFIIYRPNCLGKDQIPMCYNAAKGKTWSEVFGVTTMQDMIAKLQEWDNQANSRYSGKSKWCMDQLLLAEYIGKYKKIMPNKVLGLEDNIHRLCRDTLVVQFMDNFFSNYPLLEKYWHKLFSLSKKFNSMSSLGKLPKKIYRIQVISVRRAIGKLPKKTLKKLYKIQITSVRYTKGIPHTDFHMPRPYKSSKNLIDAVFETHFDSS